MRGRMTSATVGPSGYNLNQYPAQQGNHRGAHLNSNRQKRARPQPQNMQNQYGYYPPENPYYMNQPYNNQNPNYDPRAGPRGGPKMNFAGLGRGSGLIQHSESSGSLCSTSSINLISAPRQTKRLMRVDPGPIQPAGFNVAYRNNQGNNPRGDGDRPQGYQSERTQHEFREVRPEQNRVRRDHPQDAMQPTMYCPKCGDQYSSKNAQSRYSGKVPLILQCSHTVCQECIYQGLKNSKINCPVCNKDSVITQEQTPVCVADVQSIFLPNFYILGVLSYYRASSGALKNLENISFVTTSAKSKAPPVSLPKMSDRCCFGTCAKEATMYCPSCEGLYCHDCCTVMHKSTNKLMSHEPVPKRHLKQNFSLLLENCGNCSNPEMQMEFFCTDCDLAGCCYCMLDAHTEHERVPLYHLNPAELEEFKELKKTAEKALKEVLYTQKKCTRLANFDTRHVKKEICQIFGYFHGKLESLEKRLCDELESFKLTNKGLDTIQNMLQQAAEQLKALVSVNEDKHDKKLNLKLALEKLRAIDNIPRFLLNDNGQSEPVRFITQSAILDNLEDVFTLEKSEDSNYRLVTEKELPPTYVKDLDDSDNEVEEIFTAILKKSQEEDAASTKAGRHKSPVSSIKSKSTKTNKIKKEPVKRKLDMERVDVQHINSMDSFYVQHKSDMSKLVQLNKEIENFVKMGGAEPVPEPNLNELYLALYMNESHGNKEQRWCRARLTDIKIGERAPTYEMFFIDYGKTQSVDKNRIRDIPNHLAQKKPFVIECMLYNPMSVNWNKTAHYALAKVLVGKEVYMMEKSYNNGIYEVDLMVASSDGGVASVTDILVHAHNSVDPQNNDAASLDGSVSKRDIFCYSLRVYPNSKKFTKNQKEKVVIATVVDPYHIFVHLVQHQESFRAMNHAIKKAYKNAKLESCVPIEGTYVLVEYKDPIRSNYHRGFIKTVDMNNDKVHVLLVDWGLNVVVTASDIKALQEAFTKLECQAVVVKMAHIAPYGKQGSWSVASNEFLLAYYKSQDVLKMIVQDTEPEVEVALFETSRNVDVCLNALMVEHNLADSTGPISSKVEWPQYQITNSDYSEDDGLMSSLLKKVNEDDHDESDEEDLTNVKKRQIDVVKVESPHLCWVRFHEFRERESEMLRNLQIMYSEDKERKTSDTWNVDDLCVVRTDSEYARGKILEICDDQYKIYLVDKIQEITVTNDRIFIYDKFFTRYPQALTKSHLANIRPAGDTGKWSISSTEALQEIFKKQTRIYARKAAEADTELAKKSLPLDIWYAIVKFVGPLEPDQIKYISVNKSLVKLGYAFNVPKPQEPVVKKAQNGEDLLKSLLGIGAAPPEPVVKEVVAEIHAEPADPKVTTSAKDSDVDKTEKSKGAVPKKINKKKKHGKSESSNAESEQGKETDKKKVDPTEIIEIADESPKKPDEKEDQEDFSWIALIEKDLAESGVSSDLDPKKESEDSPYHKSEVAIDDWLPPFRLKKKQFRARVTCAETGGHLYLHEEDLDEVYYKMEKNIKEYFDNNHPSVTDHRWEPGQLCTIKYTDGNWYRGRILKVKNPGEITVFMIDFGSDHDLSRDVLFREVLYTDIGAFATRVKLDKVYAKSGSWLTSDYDNFHDLVTDWCKITVKGPLDVEMPLVDIYNEHGVFINQRLVEICPNLSRSSNFPALGQEDDDDDCVIESITEPSAEELLLVESFDNQLNFNDDLSTQKAWENLSFKRRPLPKELVDGKQLFMEVGGVMHIDRIAICLPGSDQSEDFYNLFADIQQAATTLPNLKDFKVGMPCLSLFSEDSENIWYRARVTGIKSADLGYVDVLFVDYGNSEAVAVKNVKAILPQHMELYQLSWEASLNIVLAEKADIITVMQVINTLDRKKKYVKLISPDPLIVDLYDKDGKLCYESLITLATIKPLIFKNASD